MPKMKKVAGGDFFHNTKYLNSTLSSLLSGNRICDYNSL